MNEFSSNLIRIWISTGEEGSNSWVKASHVDGSVSWSGGLSPDGGVQSGWIGSSNPLVVDDIVGNVIVDVFGSSSGILVESSFILRSHGSSMS